MVLPGQRRLHMKDECDFRKRLIADTLAAAEVQATIYDAGTRYRTDRDRRAACLRALVQGAVKRGDAQLVLEQDDTLLAWDNQRLVEYNRAAGLQGHPALRPPPRCGRTAAGPSRCHRLTLAKGGDWRRRITPTVTAIRRV